MKYISDDGQKIGTEAEVREYEESQRLEGKLAEEIGEYLDNVEVDYTDEQGNKQKRNLSPREFKRRETVIKDWELHKRKIKLQREDATPVVQAVDV